MKAIRPAPERAPEWAKNVRKIGALSIAVGMVVLFAAFLVAVFAIPVAAASSMTQYAPLALGPLDAVAPYAMVFVIVGIVVVLVSYLAKDTIKPKYLPFALGAGFVLLIVGIVPLVAGPGPTVTPGAEAFKFELIPSVDTTGGNTIPAGNYDSCDVEAGGTTGEWTTTEGTYDAGSKTFTANEAIDTDIATSAALWMEPNCLQLTASVRLLNGRDANGDGTTDAVNYYMRIVSISRTTLATDGSNGTLNTAGFRRDGVSETNDWLLLYRTDASTWVASCPEARQSSAMPSSCGWVNIGNHNGGAADTIFWYVILQDRGLFGYQEPAVGSSVVMQYEFGGPGVESQMFSLSIRLNSVATTNLS